MSTSSLQTLNSGDKLDGGAGTDELYAVINGSVTPGTMANIETVYVTNVSTTTVAAIDFSNATGLTNVSNQSSTFGTTLTGLASTVNVTVRDTSLAAQTVTFNDVTGSADSATVNLNNVSGNATLVVAGVETLTLASAGSATNVLAGTTLAATTKLNVTGSIGLTLGTLGSTVLTLDSSANTFVGAGVSATMAGATATTVTGGVGNDTFVLGSSSGADSVNSGAGNDTVTFSANFTTADTVTGGDGTTDTLVITTTTDAVTASASTPTTYTVTGFETITVGGAGVTGLAAAGSITPANISATATTLNIATTGATANFNVLVGTGTVVGPAGAFTLGLGGSAVGNTAMMINDLTVTDTGSLTTDSITIKNNAATGTGTANFNVFNARAITSTGYETVTIDTGTVTGVQNTVGVVTITGDIGGTTAETLKITGVNAFLMTGAHVLDIIDASALTATGTSAAATTTAAFGMSATSSATTITGSGGADRLFASSTASSVNGGAGDDSITGGAGNDTLLGAAGDDTIVGAAGNDSIDGGAGNDRIEMIALTENDTVAGGDGTADVLVFTAAYTDGASLGSAVSGFEVLELQNAATQAVAMSNFINNSTFTRIDVGQLGGGTATVANASALVTDIRFLADSAGDTLSFDRLIDSSSNSITISGRSAFTDAATTAVTAYTDLDSEIINISGSTAANDLTITTLTVADLTTLNITGDADIIFTQAIAGGIALATVNASAATGAVTVNASTSAAKVTTTGGSGVNTFNGGFVADSITGGSAGDALFGNAGADTIIGLAGNDTITGGAGADTINVGDGTADRVLLAASGSSSSLGTVTSTVTSVAITGADLITGMAAGDIIASTVANVTGVATTTTGVTTFVTAAITTATTAGNTANLMRGTYVADGVTTGSGTFVFSATGADTLYTYDADGASGAIAFQSVVLVGTSAVTGSHAYADNVLTLTLA